LSIAQLLEEAPNIFLGGTSIQGLLLARGNQSIFQIFMEESILSRFDDRVKSGKVFYDKDQETICHKEGGLEVNGDDKSYEHHS
jgi:hypothetical protein